jgi:hypothetical protein
MQSLTQRRSGKVVDKSIRFADVKKVSSGSGGPKWLTEALNKIPVSVETPASNDIATQTALYAGLAVWTFASGLSSEPSANVNADVPGVILALGFGASLYFLRKQNVKLGIIFVSPLFCQYYFEKKKISNGNEHICVTNEAG